MAAVSPRVVMLLHKSVEFDSRVRREAKTLAEHGYDVTVVELAEIPAGMERLDGFARVSALPPAWVRRLPFHAYRALFLFWFVWRAVRLRPDVIHAHDAAMLMPGIVAAKLSRAKLVYDSHELATSVPYRERGWAKFVGAIERVAVPRCAAVITVSDGIADRIRERYGLSRRPTVLRNVSDLTTSDGPSGTALRDRLGIGNAPLVLHQGAAAPGRGCLVLVRAMALVLEAHVVYLGTGMGSFDHEVEVLADELGIADRVHVLPSVPLIELLDTTREADVGVTLLEDTCENHRLALPNKLFEYIAAGVPVVASHFHELRGIVEGYGIGWLANPADPESVARALRNALVDPTSALRAEALTRAATELRWSEESQTLVKAYSELNSELGI